MLRAKGYDAHVANAGMSFDTTGGMLRRVDSAVPTGTSIVVFNPGGNDLRFFGSRSSATQISQPSSADCTHDT
jgi:acyl-CoA thioesterase-1